MPWNGQQYITDGLADVGFGQICNWIGGPAQFWPQWEQPLPPPQPQLQPQPHPWVPDLVSGEGHQNFRDYPGYGKWVQCRHRRPVNSEVWCQETQTEDEYVSSEESDAHSCCEHHQYCRPALSIMPLRVLSTVGRGNHHGPTTSPHLILPLTTTRLCLLSSLHAQHQTPLSAPFMQDARWLRTALSPTSNIL